MSDDRRFEEFIERYSETGDAEVPESWPEELRRRCTFFVRMAENTDPPAEAPPASPAETTGGEEDTVPEALTPGTGPGRYRVEREVARGGMGRILLAYDRDFRRRVAVKVLLGPASDARRISRFLQEAQATAQLEHPNIGPIYDLGFEGSGRPFFTMKWIRGRDLKEILSARREAFSLTRLVQVLEQAAMGVHFAHSRGVIHRDLKPQNIMVGDYGEVLVVDWGLAKVLGTRGSEAPAGTGEDAVSTEREEGGEVSLEGLVFGSPSYMAPEQARGAVAEIDERTDVFGLGAILFEILTGSAPYESRVLQSRLGRARAGRIALPRLGFDARPIPEALAAACRRALAPAKADRFQSARELHDALQTYIEGIHDAERRAAEAARLRAEADTLRRELEAAEERDRALRREEEALRARVRDHDSEEVKRPLWELAARAAAASDEVSAAFRRATAAYLAVLGIDPEHAAARSALADLYHARMLEAEERGERESAAFYEDLVARYHGGRYRAELEGESLVRLVSDPPGAAVFLSRYEERGPLLVAADPEKAGTTPLELSLPRGSYLARLRAPGFSEVRYPFLAGRSGIHEGNVRLHPEGSILPGFVQVPGGETIIGSHLRELQTLPRQRVFVEEFFMAAYPVTLGEYCAFLDELAEEGRPDLRDFVPFFGSEEYVVRAPGGRFEPIERLHPRVPAIALPVRACEEYVAWLARRAGKRMRLPEELEWERAARGADGRLHPWGNGFDWAFAKGAASRDGKPTPEPAGAFPRDESPFGIRDLAGSVRELCAGEYGEGYRPLRGGSWFNPYPFAFRADFRTKRAEVSRTTDAGLRACYSL